MPAAKGSDGAIPVKEYLERFPPEIRRLLQEVREVARSVAPDAEETAYRGWPMRVRTDQGAISIAGYRAHANVHFGKGASLKDPKRLLEGTGKAIRHVKVRTVADARSDDLRALIAQELAAGPKSLSLREGPGKAVLEAVRRICLGLPEVTERPSHGTPSFFFRDKKQFAQVWQGHHQDRALALWCAAPPGAQQALVAADPKRYFVPQYVGHRGWLGVRLDPKIDRKELLAILEDAYAEIAGSRPRRRTSPRMRRVRRRSRGAIR